jgi:hypothetical protein
VGDGLYRAPTESRYSELHFVVSNAGPPETG